MGQKSTKKTDSFMKARVEQSNDWMNVREIEGLKGFAEVYRQIVEGDLDPSEGIIVKTSCDIRKSIAMKEVLL